ncbi:uncharacterized protein [Malus domestica]|uniref:uncharacterized protein n=1 Tax=Malus domestica TaxID=3750 RepID=UPI0039749E8A
MSNLNKLDFSALKVSGRNYLKWVQDVKLHLTAKGIRATIEAPIANKPVDEAQKAITMIFLRRHIYDALQTEYLAEEDPRTLWLALANRFDHQKNIYLPKARHDCGTNRIRSLGKYSFDLPCHQYCPAVTIQAQKFTKFLDLIFVLLLAEKQNQLLMKNHQARPTGSNFALEAHATYSSTHKRRKNRRGRGNGRQAQTWAQGQQSAAPKRRNVTQQRPPLTPKVPNFKNKGKAPVQAASTELDMCYRCGSKDHWSRVCRVFLEAIAKYHSRCQSNFAHMDHPEDATTSMRISDFQKASTPMDE